MSACIIRSAYQKRGGLSRYEDIISQLFCRRYRAVCPKKHDAGFLYYSSEHTLHQFDRFCTDCCISTPEVTKSLVNAWLGSFENCCAVTIAGKASVIRQFSLYLLSIGRDAYIPAHMPQGKHRQIHVLTDPEISALFDKIDQYEPGVNAASFHRLAMEYRVLFRAEKRRCRLTVRDIAY